MADLVTVTSSDIQIKYRKLYKFLMKFLWEYKVVESLANLEMAIYRTFPDKAEMQRYLLELQKGIKDTYNELSDDEPEFEHAYSELEQSIDDYDPDNALVDLHSVVIPDEEVSEIEETKEVFHAGDITKTAADDAVNDAVEENEEEDKLRNPFED